MKVKIGNVERIVTDEVGKRLLRINKDAEEIKEEMKPVEEMKVADLKVLAKEKGIEGADAMKKEELLEALKGCE